MQIYPTYNSIHCLKDLLECFSLEYREKSVYFITDSRRLKLKGRIKLKCQKDTRLWHSCPIQNSSWNSIIIFSFFVDTILLINPSGNRKRNRCHLGRKLKERTFLKKHYDPPFKEYLRELLKGTEPSVPGGGHIGEGACVYFRFASTKGPLLPAEPSPAANHMLLFRALCLCARGLGPSFTPQGGRAWGQRKLRSQWTHTAGGLCVGRGWGWAGAC